MKHCNACQATYSDRVDFCFHDGVVLVGTALATNAFGGSGLDLPPQRGMRSADTDAPAVPRARRRSLLGGQREPVVAAATPGPVDRPLAPLPPSPTEGPGYTPPEPAPPPPPLPWIEPPAARFSAVEATPTDLHEDDDAPALAAALVTPAPITDTPPPVRTRGTPSPAPQAEPPATFDELPPLPSDVDAEPAPRPQAAWMIPALVGGALALVLVLGVGVVALGGAAAIGLGTNPPPVPAAVAPPPPAPPPVAPPPPEVAPAPEAPTPVHVRLETVPPGAAVQVDGTPRGASPVELDLEPGAHAVRVELAGFTAIDRAVEISADAPAIAPFVLVPAATPALPGDPVAAPPSAPSPAAPTVAPPPTAPTPPKPVEPPPTAWGAEPTPPPAAPAPAAPTPPTALPPAVREGRVLVTGTGTLSVDGALIGPLPASVKLTEGTHQFTVSTDGGPTTTVSRDVTFGENGRAVLQL